MQISSEFPKKFIIINSLGSIPSHIPIIKRKKKEKEKNVVQFSPEVGSLSPRGPIFVIPDGNYKIATSMPLMYSHPKMSLIAPAVWAVGRRRGVGGFRFSSSCNSSLSVVYLCRFLQYLVLKSFFLLCYSKFTL